MSFPTTPLVSRQADPGSSDYRVLATAGSRITWQANLAVGYLSLPSAVSGASIQIANLISNYGSVNGELAGNVTEAAVLCRAAVIVAGVTTPLTFDGQQAITLARGGSVYSDPLASSLPTNALVRIEFVTTVNNQALSLSGGYDPNNGPQGTTLGNDVVYSAGAGFADAGDNVRILAPVAVFGTPAVPPSAAFTSNRVAAFGDSIGQGLKAFAGGVTAANVAYWWAAQAGHRGKDYADRPADYASARKQTLLSCPIFLWQWGVNDLQNNDTAAAMAGRVQAFAAEYKAAGGRRLILTTTTPLTESTDGWATVANQTPRYPAEQPAYNAWVRSVASSGLSGLEVRVVDVAAIIEGISGATGKWPANWVTDGVHPGAGETPLSTALTGPLSAAITDPLPVPDATAPAVPTGLVAKAGDTIVYLTWANPTDPDFAVVKLRRGGTVVYAGTGTSYLDAGRVNGTALGYTLSATDATGNESALSAPLTVTPRAYAYAAAADVRLGVDRGDGTLGTLSPALTPTQATQLATIATEIAKVPRVGQTARHRRGSEYVDVTLEAAP